MTTNIDTPLVIYDQCVRWVAALNMAFVVAGIWFALRFCSGPPRYLIAGFLILFSLFWIRDLLFGFRLKLFSDGVTLQWQDGKKTGSAPLAAIRKVLIGVRKPRRWNAGAPMPDPTWTCVTLKLSNGIEQDLPPNIANGLHARKWRNLKRLVSHLRTVSNVTVEPIKDPELTTDGWVDEPNSALDVGSSHR